MDLISSQQQWLYWFLYWRLTNVIKTLKIFIMALLSSFLQTLASAGTASAPVSDHHGILPYILAFLSSVIWPLAWIYSNEHGINMAESTMIRGMTGSVANYVLCRLTGSDIVFSNTPTFNLLLLRSLIMSGSSICIAASQYILPLPIVHTIISSSVLFTFVIDFYLNNARINLKQGVGITIGVIGMMLASNGRLLETVIDGGYTEDSRFGHYATGNVYIIGGFTALFVGVVAGWSYAFVLTKRLKCNPFQINYFLGLTSLFSGTLLLQFLPQSPTPTHSHSFYSAILYTGIPLLFDQWFLVGAVCLSHETGIISMMSYNSIIVAYLVGLLRYGERPNIFVNVGIVLLAIGMYQTLFNASNRNGDADGDQVESVGDDNQDGTFRRGIHRSMCKKESLQIGGGAFLGGEGENKGKIQGIGGESISGSVLLLRYQNSNEE